MKIAASRSNKGKNKKTGTKRESEREGVMGLTLTVFIFEKD